MDYLIIPVMTSAGKKLAAVRFISKDDDQFNGIDLPADCSSFVGEVLAFGEDEQDLQEKVNQLERK